MTTQSARSAPSPVLYVEDHPVNVMVMQAIFDKRPEFKLKVATSGAEALRLATHWEWRLLLLDLRLPDCHGVGLLKQLRQMPGCEVAPAVAVTAESDFSLAGSGFCDHWPKPLDLGGVMARLDALVSPAFPTAATARSRASMSDRWAAN